MRPQDSILGELVEINAEKLKKARIFILIARDVFVALSIVVANKGALHLWKRQFHFGFTANSYDQMQKSIKTSWTNCLHYKTLRIYIWRVGWAGGEGVQSDLENCAYLWKTPGYAPAYSERKITYLNYFSLSPVIYFNLTSADKRWWIDCTDTSLTDSKISDYRS